MYMKFSTTPLAGGLPLASTVFDAYALRQAYYDPVIGRFTSFDDFEASPSDPMALHKYVYANDNPINNIDPSGHSAFSVAGQIAAAGIRGVLRSMFLPTLSVTTLATRTGIGLITFAYSQSRLYHYDAPLAQSLERLASIVQPISAMWGDRLSKMAGDVSSRLLGKTVLSYATSFYIPQFAGSHVSLLTTGAIGASAYLPFLGAEATAMAFVKQWSGLDINISVNALNAAENYLTFQLDPAGDIDLFGDAILAARHGDWHGSANAMGRLIKSLMNQYDVRISGTYHGQNLDAYFKANL